MADRKVALVPADLCDEEAVTGLRDTILEEHGHIDAVVVSVGSYYYGHRMHRMPRADWDRSVQDNLVTHFNLQRTFVDQLRRQNAGTYVTLTGPEAESIHPDEGVMSIMAAAQRMMSRVVAYEAFDADIRVHTITVHTSIRTRSRGEDVNPDWISSRDLGTYVAAVLEGTLPGAHEVVHELRGREHVESILKKAAR
jgi:NAD(P)-dependent dehydrogenase (short-subunit alcohol dehydrogenase family)